MDIFVVERIHKRAWPESHFFDTTVLRLRHLTQADFCVTAADVDLDDGATPIYMVRAPVRNLTRYFDPESGALELTADAALGRRAEKLESHIFTTCAKGGSVIHFSQRRNR